MGHSSDIANLYDHFDGNPVEYQESMQQSDALHAKSRWPLLAATVFTGVAPPPVARVTAVAGAAVAADRVAADPTAHADAATPADQPKAQFVAPRRKVLSSAALSDWAATTAATAPTEADVRIARQYETT